MTTASVVIDTTILTSAHGEVAATASYVRPDTGERVTFRGTSEREVVARAKLHMLQTWLKVRPEPEVEP